MNWSDLSKQQKLTAAGVAVLLLIEAVLLVYLVKGGGGGNRKELSEVKQKVTECIRLSALETKVAADLKAATEELEILQKHVPPLSDRYAWAFEYASRCSSRAKVKVDQVEELSFSRGKDKKEPEIYEVSIALRCGYTELVDFIWQMEKENPLLFVRDVTVVAVAGQPKAHQIRMAVQWPSSFKIERGAL